jgi:hypothetical protein
MPTPAKPDDLDDWADAPEINSLLPVDPDLVQLYTERGVALKDTITRTPSDIRKLQNKRNLAIKESNKVTREQRRRDMSIKLLKPEAVPLTALRNLDVGNYFCVPHDQTRAIRAMVFREAQQGNPSKFTTTKFKWAHIAYLKVKRVA